MDVRCPECQTLYEFDDSRLESGSATLKCRKCQHMFKLGADARPSREDERRWMLRDADRGDLLYLSSFDTLHRWIVERKVDRSWQISRSGDDWTKLGDIGEFRPIFQVVDNVSSIEGQEAVETASSSSGEISSSGGSGRSKRETLEQFRQGGGTGEAEGAEPTSASSPAAKSGEAQTAEAPPDRERSAAEQNADPSERSNSPRSTPVPSTGDQGRHAGASGSQKIRADDPSESAQLRGEATVAGESRTDGSGGGRRGGRPGTSDPERQEGPEASNVQLDSGMFGEEEAVPADSEEEWSFGGDEVPLEETTQVAEEEISYAGGRRWSVVFGVALVLLAGGVYLWMYERDRLRRFIGMADSGEPVELDQRESASEKPKEMEPLARSRESLGEALSAARRDLQERSAERLRAAQSAAGGEIGAALEPARKAAREEAPEKKEEESQSVTSLLRSANRELQSGSARKAREIYHSVIEREPTNSEAITGLGWSLLALGSPGSARAQFEKALHHNPSFGDAYIGLGQSNRQMGNHRKALEAYKDYLERLPDGSQASIARHQRDRLKKRLGLN